MKLSGLIVASVLFAAQFASATTLQYKGADAQNPCTLSIDIDDAGNITNLKASGKGDLNSFEIGSSKNVQNVIGFNLVEDQASGFSDKTFSTSLITPLSKQETVWVRKAITVSAIVAMLPPDQSKTLQDRINRIAETGLQIGVSSSLFDDLELVANEPIRLAPATLTGLKISDKTRVGSRILSDELSVDLDSKTISCDSLTKQ